MNNAVMRSQGYAVSMEHDIRRVLIVKDLDLRVLPTAILLEKSIGSSVSHLRIYIRKSQ